MFKQPGLTLHALGKAPRMGSFLIYQFTINILQSNQSSSMKTPKSWDHYWIVLIQLSTKFFQSPFCFSHGLPMPTTLSTNIRHVLDNKEDQMVLVIPVMYKQPISGKRCEMDLLPQMHILADRNKDNNNVHHIKARVWLQLIEPRRDRWSAKWQKNTIVSFPIPPVVENTRGVKEAHSKLFPILNSRI